MKELMQVSETKPCYEIFVKAHQTLCCWQK